MAQTFYVPIENRSLPADDPTRWHILVVEETSPVDATMGAMTYSRTLPRSIVVTPDGRRKQASYTVWAAVRDIPSFAYMQSLRDNFDALKSVRLRHKRSERRIPGYV